MDLNLFLDMSQTIHQGPKTISQYTYISLDCPIISMNNGGWFVHWETNVRGIKQVALLRTAA